MTKEIRNTYTDFKMLFLGYGGMSLSYWESLSTKINGSVKNIITGHDYYEVVSSSKQT